MSERIVAFDPGDLAATERAVDAALASGAEVTVDLGEIDQLAPAAIASLEALGERASESGGLLGLRGARPRVYKALQVARVAGLYQRR